MAQRVTIVDVAREAGVAISTVSAALNGRPGVSDATRDKVSVTARRMGFVPSLRGRSLSAKKTFQVALVVQRATSVLEADPFFWGFIAGIESVLDDSGYALLLQTVTDRTKMLERIRDLRVARGVDGIFLADVRTDDLRFSLVQELELPAVAINVAPASSPVPTVNQDHEQALRQLVRLLVGQGHTRIAHVAGPQEYVHARQRLQVWRDELRSAGLADDLLVAGDFTLEGGVRAAHQLWTQGMGATAVMCANDLTAIGLLSAARSLGVDVPGDVSVTGFDGIQLGAFASPPITTATTSPYELGRHAARLLLEAIEGAPREDVTIEPASVLERESVAPPRAG